MDDSDYWGRIKARMKEVGINQTQLASRMGLPSQSAISNLIKGKRHLRASEKLDLEHILMIEAPTNVTAVPLIGLTSAGNWREAVEMPVRKVAVLEGVAGPRSFAVEVKGDSMDMLIEDGGYVVVDPDRSNLFDGSVYLIENGDHETTVKRYLSSPARFSPMSRNPEHREFFVGDHPFKVIGRVVWKGGIVA